MVLYGYLVFEYLDPYDWLLVSRWVASLPSPTGSSEPLFLVGVVWETYGRQTTHPVEGFDKRGFRRDAHL